VRCSSAVFPVLNRSVATTSESLRFLLELPVVCPISKEPLRFDAAENRLVCDAIGVAYPINDDGLVNLIPREAEMLGQSDE
jgi:uncharacterized protein YbaR (Trm112 family)